MVFENYNEIDTLNNLGMQSCYKGDYESGLKYFNTALELDENNIMVLYNKGGCLVSLGGIKNLFQFLEKLLNFVMKQKKLNLI